MNTVHRCCSKVRTITVKATTILFFVLSQSPPSAFITKCLKLRLMVKLQKKLCGLTRNPWILRLPVSFLNLNSTRNYRNILKAYMDIAPSISLNIHMSWNWEIMQMKSRNCCTICIHWFWCSTMLPTNSVCIRTLIPKTTPLKTWNYWSNA